MTPAEELRQAAATIRARAKEASPGPWNTNGGHDADVWADDDAGPAMIADCCYGPHPTGDSEHIATWSPPVALAVAAWLDVTADGVEVVDEIAAARGFVTHHRRTGEEWALARLINGTPA